MSKQEAPADWPTYLRAAMDAAGYTTASELARVSGVSEPVASRWLRGITQPDVANLRKVAPALRIPILQLLVAAGHLTVEEARLRELKVPAAPVVRRGISTDGLDPEQERALEVLVETMRAQNPASRKTKP